MSVANSREPHALRERARGGLGAGLRKPTPRTRAGGVRRGEIASELAAVQARWSSIPLLLPGALLLDGGERDNAQISVVACALVRHHEPVDSRAREQGRKRDAEPCLPRSVEPVLFVRASRAGESNRSARQLEGGSGRVENGSQAALRARRLARRRDVGGRVAGRAIDECEGARRHEQRDAADEESCR